MKSKIFQFYPPKKEKNPILLPDSNLLTSSNLVPLSKNAKKRKFCGATNTKPAFGPVNAQPIASALAIIPGPSIAGYGNSNYGALPYGEAEEELEPILMESEEITTTSRKKYLVYDKYQTLFDTVVKY